MRSLLDGYEAIFDSSSNPEVKVSKGGLRYVQIGKFVVMEQNKNKDSIYAKAAKSGANIAWVFKDGKYMFVIVNGWMTKPSRAKKGIERLVAKLAAGTR